MTEVKMVWFYALCTVAMQGRSLSFNQFNPQSAFQFPGVGVMLPKFSRPALVPKLIVPSVFIFAAKGKEFTMVANETEEDEMLVNTVWNNLENYLPVTVIDELTEVESLR